MPDDLGHLTPDEFRALGHELVEWAARYLESLEDVRVLPDIDPGWLRDQLPAEAPEAAEPWPAILADLDRLILPSVSNWQSPRFAELYVYTDPAVRGRGWGKSVVHALVGMILKTGRTPLYVVSENNEYSIRLAAAVGFVDTGHREYVGQALRTS